MKKITLAKILLTLATLLIMTVTAHAESGMLG